MSKLCAIHQPNFFPWSGYFDKIKKSDVFVFLDNVQFQKTGGTWTNRVQLNARGHAKWFTCPVLRKSGFQKVSEIECYEIDWKNRFLRVLYDYYRDYPNYTKAIRVINEILQRTYTSKLSDFNMEAIQYLSDYFRLECLFVKQSELKIEGHATALLVDLVKSVGCEKYLCGNGSSGYQEDELFIKNEIELIYQKYTETPWEDSRYIPGLSIIDTLMRQSDV